jgi:hypothetical protein
MSVLAIIETIEWIQCYSNKKYIYHVIRVFPFYPQR